MSQLDKVLEDLERLLGSSVGKQPTDRTKTRIEDAHLGRVLVRALNDTYTWKRMRDTPRKNPQPEMIQDALKRAEDSKNAALDMLSSGGADDPAGLLNSYLEKYLNKVKDGVFRYNHSSRQVVFDETSGVAPK